MTASCFGGNQPVGVGFCYLLYEWAEQHKIPGFVSPTVVQICSYWITKAYGVEKAKEIMTALLAFVVTIDTPHEQVFIALHSSIKGIEDALLYYPALHHGLDYIISGDRAFQNTALPTLQVISPAHFIEMVG